jgi:hypothetical protein
MTTSISDEPNNEIDNLCEETEIDSVESIDDIDDIDDLCERMSLITVDNIIVSIGYLIENEVWREIPGFPKYEISSWGCSTVIEKVEKGRKIIPFYSFYDHII